MFKPAPAAGFSFGMVAAGVAFRNVRLLAVSRCLSLLCVGRLALVTVGVKYGQVTMSAGYC